MDNIKLSLSIVLPGRTLWSREESLKPLMKVQFNKNGKPIKDKAGNVVRKEELCEDYSKHESISVTLQNGRQEETIKVLVRKCKPAKQVINLTQEAYDEMVSNTKPYGFKGNWQQLSRNQKLKWHCDQIAASLGGTVENFQVME